MNSIYTLSNPNKIDCPIIISIPHSGVNFPDDIASKINESQLNSLDDTDWFVHELYDFANEIGIPVIKANYHRWVVDLNRDPESSPLYSDGRLITTAVPTTDFLGNQLYKSKNLEPTQNEIQNRIETYFNPYHQAIENLLEDTKQTFGKAVLWDAHSIKRKVPSIRKEAFPDLILGNNDEQTAAAGIIHTVLEALNTADFTLNHNTPFKGGYITRKFGSPNKRIHALQLEMAKDLYMDDTEKNYHVLRANKVRKVLLHTFNELKSIL